MLQYRQRNKGLYIVTFSNLDVFFVLLFFCLFFPPVWMLFINITSWAELSHTQVFLLFSKQHFRSKYLGTELFLVKSNIWSQKTWVWKSLVPKIWSGWNCCSTFFLSPNNFGSKQSLVPKIWYGWNCWSNIFLSPNNFGSKQILVPKQFGLQKMLVANVR